MQLFMILAFLIAMIAVLFTLQNTMPVTVVFLAWTFKGSLALVLFLALAAGALISLFASMPTLIKSSLTVAGQKKKVAQLEDRLEELEFTLQEARRHQVGGQRKSIAGDGETGRK